MDCAAKSTAKSQKGCICGLSFALNLRSPFVLSSLLQLPTLSPSHEECQAASLPRLCLLATPDLILHWHE